MNYPLISEYVEAIRQAEKNFDKLSRLRPVFDSDGNPVMLSGSSAVVFKMTDGEKDYAIKCFTREQEGRTEAYRRIADELEFVSFSYLCPIRFYEKELFISTSNSSEPMFPVLQMNWTEGVTLDNYVRENLHDTYALENLAYQFCRMAQWLLTQPFAHGDLQPNNILVQADGSLVLVDYDDMFVPAMKGQKARELGNPNYRHPLRTEEQFDEHTDDFALACITLSLKAISLKPELHTEFGSADHLLFSEADFREPTKSKLIAALQPLMADADFARLFGLFLLAHSQQSLSNVSFRLFSVSKPEKLSTEVTEEDLADAWVDEFGVKYSKDKKRLLTAPRDIKEKEYSIIPGTKVICDYAFLGCKSLQSINIPNSVTSIGNSAYAGCSSLQSINIPNSVTSIGDEIFYKCNNLQIKVNSSKFFSDGFCLIDLSSQRLICCHKDVENYIIPSSVTNIGNSAFSSCRSLQNIDIPNSVTNIGDWAFIGCGSLQSINIPDSVTSIGNYAFSQCKALQSINIPNSVTSIGKEAFSGCKSLQSINIPNSVTSIGDKAFAGCTALQSIYIPVNTREKFEKILGHSQMSLAEA